jgi:hypothetical protein
MHASIILEAGSHAIAMTEITGNNIRAQPRHPAVQATCLCYILMLDWGHHLHLKPKLLCLSHYSCSTFAIPLLFIRRLCVYKFSQLVTSFYSKLFLSCPDDFR